MIKEETKCNKAKEEILRTLPYEKKRAKGSRQITDELRFNVSQTYISTLLREMAQDGIICSKRIEESERGHGFCYWNKEIIQEKKTKGKETQRRVFTVLTSLKYNEVANVREIVEKMLQWKMNGTVQSVSTAMSKMYCNHIVKRSKILYRDGYCYWLEGEEEDKNIEREPMQKKSVTTIITNNTRLKHANDLHNLNVSLRELIGKYRNNNKELKRMVDSRDEKIEQQERQIAYLSHELQDIAAIKTGQDVVKDILKSREILAEEQKKERSEAK